MENGFTLTLHGLTFGFIAAILGLLLQQNKVWTRMKDRVNSLWKEYCDEKDIPFVSLDGNGK